jgi:hypothetical protein
MKAFVPVVFRDTLSCKIHFSFFEEEGLRGGLDGEAAKELLTFVIRKAQHAKPRRG